MTPNGPLILQHQLSNIHKWILNRPHQLNSLSVSLLQLMQQLMETVTTVTVDATGNTTTTNHTTNHSDTSTPGNKLLWLQGQGRAFCAGGDVKAVLSALETTDDVKGTQSTVGPSSSSSTPSTSTSTIDPSTPSTSTSLGRMKTALAFFQLEYQLNHQLGSLLTARGVPALAWLNGITMGGGVGLSVHLPFRVATESTLFAMPETLIGLFPDVGGTFFLPRLLRPPQWKHAMNTGEIKDQSSKDAERVGGSQRACSPFGMFLGLTGWRLKGESVLFSGVATHYIPKEKEEEVQKEVNQLLADHQETVSKQNMDRQEAQSALMDQLSELLSRHHRTPEAETTVHWEFGGVDGVDKWRTMEWCFGADTVETIMERLHQCAEPDPAPTSLSPSTRTTTALPPPSSPASRHFAKHCLTLLDKMSPLSLKITHEQLHRGAHLSFQRCFDLEYRLVQHVLYALQHAQAPLEAFSGTASKLASLYSHDFRTGVKALLVDKPPTVPQWMPPRLDLVSREWVQWYFEPLPMEGRRKDKEEKKKKGEEEKEMLAPLNFSNDVDYDEYPYRWGLPDRQAVLDAYLEVTSTSSAHFPTSPRPIAIDELYAYFLKKNRGSVDRQRAVRNMIDWVVAVDFQSVDGVEPRIVPRL